MRLNQSLLNLITAAIYKLQLSVKWFFIYFIKDTGGNGHIYDDAGLPGIGYDLPDFKILLQ